LKGKEEEEDQKGGGWIQLRLLINRGAVGVSVGNVKN